ncbi:DUF5638 domain-containing protein [Legionella sp. WA2022007384]
MPNSLEIRLASCRNILLGLHLDYQFYGNNDFEPKIKQQLDEVDTYYKDSFEKSAVSSHAIIESYELFVSYLVKVKKGEISAEQALAGIQEATFNRKLAIVFYNIAKALEMTFWAIAIPFFLLSAVSVSVPNPICGISLTIIFTALMLKSINNFFDCINDFKSCTRLLAEDERERSLVSFFKPAISSLQESKEVSSEVVNLDPIFS